MPKEDKLAFLDHLSRTVRDRSRTVSRPLVLAGVAALALAPIASAVPAGAAVAAEPSSIILLSGNATFHVGGHTWQMSVFPANGSVSIDLSTGHEFDIWTFVAVPTSDFKVSSSKGTATFNTHSSLAPVAFANLRFSPSSRHKESCHTGSETVFDGKVTGSITLVANHKGLKFKSAHVTFRGATLDVDHQCTQRGGVQVCLEADWGVGVSPSASGTSLGLPGRIYPVQVGESTMLSRPEAFVFHEVSGVTRKPVFDSKTKRLSVKATGAVKGSAVLVAKGRPRVTTLRCTLGHTHYKERDASYSGKFSSPAGGEFHARSLIAGLIKVARSGLASFDIASLKKT
jgi:hypothetical protein